MIERIKIENFKCFEFFEISKLKKINLITGKNNIGKSALLEALYLHTCKKEPFCIITRLKEISENRNNFFEVDFFFDENKEIKISSNISDLNLKISKNIYPLTLKIDNKDFQIDNFFTNAMHIKSKVPLLPQQNVTSNTVFISSARQKDILPKLYKNIIENFQEENLIKALNEFDKNIQDIKMLPANDNPNIVFKIKINNKFILLNSFGEGMHRFISIISAIWSAKNGYLFIDEIENGIHYTKYQLLWELIYKNAKNANTQVFITTHSKECIEAFNAVNDNSGILIELYKNRKNQLTSKIRNKEQLEYSLTHQGKFRGE